MAGQKPMQTEFGIRYRLESCVTFKLTLSWLICKYYIMQYAKAEGNHSTTRQEKLVVFKAFAKEEKHLTQRLHKNSLRV